ncbi:srsf protein kinase 2 [Phaffia rhodozyma]|uniref:non-specific serine/threonine protein kinase n=1 Tax=Phaffia rhodozyma TaxID=264483 RepID=A0A0F7SHA9_PHARH|nr:srsf protein kinase 2 [Phaffia rhodozyma]
MHLKPKGSFSSSFKSTTASISNMGKSFTTSSPKPIPAPAPVSPSLESPIPSNPSSSQSATSVMTEDEEDLEGYRQGGYHPVRIGDLYKDGRYVIIRKLGWGHFSTVWLARDNIAQRHVALKVVKSDSHYTETALDEIQLLQRLSTADPNHPGKRHVVALLDDFQHVGPNGTHVCMVFEVLGENLLGLIKRYQHRGVPPHIVQQIAKQVLLGLDYLHSECQIIHTDLKPENVLICIDDVESVVAAELASCPAAVPTKLVGVPPSQGRGGTQTPKSEGIFIVGSQPLPSPSSSYGSNHQMLDKYNFGMTSMTNESASSSLFAKNAVPAAGSNQKTALPSKGSSSTSSISSSTGSDLHFGEKTQVTPAIQYHGPSLLSQQVHGHPSPSMAPTAYLGSTLPPSYPSSNTNNTNNPSSNFDSAFSSVSTTTTVGTASSTSNMSAPNTPTPQTPNDGPATPPPINISTSIMSSLSVADDGAPDGDDIGVNSSVSDTKYGTVPQSHGAGARSLPDYPVAPGVNDPAGLPSPPPAPYDPASLERITVKIADLGNACWVDHHFTNDIQTRQYRCPEIILGTQWGPTVDNWSAACLTFELVTGDYLFDPQPGTKYDKDDDHMAQIIELLGEIPKQLATSGRYSQELFNKKGELRHIHKLRYWPITSVLKEKYGMTDEEADLFSSFLTPMLNVWGTKRAQAKDMLDHPWLGGVVVQGELDCLEREEKRRPRTNPIAESLGGGAADASWIQPPKGPIEDTSAGGFTPGSGNPISLPPKSAPSKAVPQKKTGGFNIKA